MRDSSVTPPPTDAGLSMLSLLTFRAFGNTFRIITDAPDIARLGPVYRFGAAVEQEAYALQWSSPRTLALVKDADMLASLICEMPGARPVPCGPDLELLYSETGACAAARLPENRADAECAALSAVPVFVRLEMLKSDWLFLHAAAACAGGNAVAFVGDNECGKSTLARVMVSWGWDLYSDDSLPVVQMDQDVCAIPVREAVNARTLEARAVSELKRRGYADCGLEGFLLPPKPACPCPAPVRLILYPEWGDPHDEPLADAAPVFAYRKLLAACNSPLWGDGLRFYVKILDQLMARSRHIRVTLTRGAPPHAARLQSLVRDMGLWD